MGADIARLERQAKATPHAAASADGDKGAAKIRAATLQRDEAISARDIALVEKSDIQIQRDALQLAVTRLEHERSALALSVVDELVTTIPTFERMRFRAHTGHLWCIYFNFCVFVFVPSVMHFGKRLRSSGDR